MTMFSYPVSRIRKKTFFLRAIDDCETYQSITHICVKNLEIGILKFLNFILNLDLKSSVYILALCNLISNHLSFHFFISCKRIIFLHFSTTFFLYFGFVFFFSYFLILHLHLHYKMKSVLSLCIFCASVAHF